MLKIHLEILFWRRRFWYCFNGSNKKENKIFNNIDNDKYLRLKLACEKTKIELSKYDSTKIILENFLPFYDINKTITKKEFSDICKTLFTKFKKILKDFINISNINDKKELISDIILIGGSSKIPAIKTILQEEFPLSRIRNDLEPKTCVAKGAAIRASMITNPEEFCDINLIDVTNLSLGTNVYDEKKKKDITSIIIKRSSELPAYWEKIYKTKEDNQTSIFNEI